jgi:hypothetical protein
MGLRLGGGRHLQVGLVHIRSVSPPVVERLFIPQDCSSQDRA